MRADPASTRSCDGARDGRGREAAPASRRFSRELDAARRKREPRDAGDRPAAEAALAPPEVVVAQALSAACREIARRVPPRAAPLGGTGGRPAAGAAGAGCVDAVVASVPVESGARVEVAVRAVPGGVAVSLVAPGKVASGLAASVPALARRLAVRGVRLRHCVVRRGVDPAAPRAAARGGRR